MSTNKDIPMPPRLEALIEAERQRPLVSDAELDALRRRIHDDAQKVLPQKPGAESASAPEARGRTAAAAGKLLPVLSHAIALGVGALIGTTAAPPHMVLQPFGAATLQPKLVALQAQVVEGLVAAKTPAEQAQAGETAALGTKDFPAILTPPSVSAAVPHRTSTVAEEARLIDGARSAIKLGNCSEALSILALHAQRFPGGSLERDRMELISIAKGCVPGSLPPR